MIIRLPVDTYKRVDVFQEQDGSWTIEWLERGHSKGTISLNAILDAIEKRLEAEKNL